MSPAEVDPASAAASSADENPAPRLSVRLRLLAVSGIAVLPVVLFASVVSIQHAYGAQGFLVTAAWIGASVLPVLFGAGAVLLISLSTEAYVLEWIRYLERIAHAYARGRYGIRPKRFQYAPSEFQALGAAVWDMAASIQDRDKALRAALDEQSVLLREVHHRVKNNLQIVGSLLSMQAGRSDNSDVREALCDALVRIDAMALAQRFMAPREGEDQVSAGALFEGFVSQFRSRIGHESQGRSLSLSVEDQIIGLDAGARLILISSETLLRAYRRPSAGPVDYSLALNFPAVDRVQLSLTAIGDERAFDPVPDNLSTSLIDGYLRQVHGEQTLSCDPGRATMTVRAPI